MPAIGHFVLHSNFMPSITAGKYELKTEQTGLPFDVAAETTHLHVAAPRFTMPTEQILSSFPPANAEGAFGDRLPQVVLKRRTLPWERNPAGGSDPSPTGTPWLALVVVAEGEAELSTATPVAECATAGKLNPGNDKDVEQGLYLAVTATVVRKIFPTRQDLPLLTHVRQVDINDTELANGDDDGWLAVVLANRLPVFDVAGGKPVRYMACLVNLEGQLDALPLPQPAVETFTWELAQNWSVLATVGTHTHPDVMVMGQAVVNSSLLPKGLVLNQVPRAAAQGAPSALFGDTGKVQPQTALDGAQTLLKPPVVEQWAQATQKVTHAALDPDAKRVVRDTMGLGFRFPIGQFALEPVLRFPVLAHWSFTTTEGATFESLMQGLDVGLLGMLPPEAEAQPGKPQPPPRPDDLPEVVATGHIGLAHRSRRGDAVRAWYRGPCVPVATARDGESADKPLPLAHAADQLRRVIPDGREDLTLAAAFEIGRLLALSQLSVVSALLRFRAEQFGAGRVREILAQLVPFKLPPLVSNDGPKKVDLGRFVAVQMLDALASNRERMLGPQRPIADPGRELKVEGDIDRMIASGLGLDHDGIVKLSQQIGMLAALERTAAPVVGKVGGDKFGNLQLATLHDTLTAELNRTLAVAMPARPQRPGAQRGAQRGAAAAANTPARDALDDLLARSPPDEEEPTA